MSVINPKTGRKVKIGGKVYKDLVASGVIISNAAKGPKITGSQKKSTSPKKSKSPVKTSSKKSKSPVKTSPKKSKAPAKNSPKRILPLFHEDISKHGAEYIVVAGSHLCISKDDVEKFEDIANELSEDGHPVELMFYYTCEGLEDDGFHATLGNSNILKLYTDAFKNPVPAVCFKCSYQGFYCKLMDLLIDAISIGGLGGLQDKTGLIDGGENAPKLTYYEFETYM